jgi:hypothetical protein
MANTLEYNTSRSDANFTYETLDAVNPVLYLSIDTILCIMLTMPVTSAIAERSFSVLRQLKTYVRSTMNNDRLSSCKKNNTLFHNFQYFFIFEI